MNTAQFPKSVKFPPTAIGQSKTKTLSLECGIPIDFEFQLSCLQPHPAFTVSPMKGTCEHIVAVIDTVTSELIDSITFDSHHTGLVPRLLVFFFNERSG